MPEKSVNDVSMKTIVAIVTLVAIIVSGVVGTFAIFARKSELKVHADSLSLHLNIETHRLLGSIETSNEQILKRLERIERHLDARHPDAP